MANIIAQRALRHGEARTPVTVRVYRPERHPDDRVEAWKCRVEWDGLDIPAQSGFGQDSAEALFNALDIVGAEVRRREGLRYGDAATAPGERWNPWPIERGPAALPIPDPLPGDVIIERTLLVPGASESTARIAVRRPQPKGADEWICWYEITVTDHPDLNKQRCSVGTDSAQALFHALVRIKWDIESRGLTHPHVDNPWEISLEPVESRTLKKED